MGDVILGGGGSYSGPSPRTTEESERIFRSAVEEAKLARTSKTYGLFISHAWEYSDQYRRVEAMLNDAPQFAWRNYSVPEHDPLHTKSKKELEAALYNQIKPASAVIILAGMYVPYREWIQEEIDIAVKMGKPIIAVAPRGSQRMPQAVQEVADAVVGWASKSMTDAIRRYAK